MFLILVLSLLVVTIFILNNKYKKVKQLNQHLITELSNGVYKNTTDYQERAITVELKHTIITIDLDDSTSYSIGKK